MAYRRPFVPDGFRVPAIVDGPSFRLRPLTVDDVAQDFAAVMGSVDHLRGVFAADDPWPKGLTFRQNLVDLGWHEKEFQTRRSFCYVVMSPDQRLYRGCGYIYPSDKAGADAEIFLWVTKAEAERGFDAELFDFYRRWIAEAWPFKRPIYPGRTTSWADYGALA